MIQNGITCKYGKKNISEGSVSYQDMTAILNFKDYIRDKIIKMTQRDCSPIKGPCDRVSLAFLICSDSWLHMWRGLTAVMDEETKKMIAKLCSSINVMQAEKETLKKGATDSYKTPAGLQHNDLVPSNHPPPNKRRKTATEAADSGDEEEEELCGPSCDYWKWKVNKTGWHVGGGCWNSIQIKIKELWPSRMCRKVWSLWLTVVEMPELDPSRWWQLRSPRNFKELQAAFRTSV